MGAMTKPFFIVSSGRSGTATMERLLSAFPQVEMHHEYMVNQVQPAAIKFHMGISGFGEATHTVRRFTTAKVRCGATPRTSSRG